MVGGYVTALLMNRAGAPFLATLPVALVLQRFSASRWSARLYRPLYGASPARSSAVSTIRLVLMAEMPITAYLIGDRPPAG